MNATREQLRGARVADEHPEPVNGRPALHLAAADLSELILDPADPLPTARRFRHDAYSHGARHALFSDGELFYVFVGHRYEELREAAVRAKAYLFLETAKKWVRRGEAEALTRFKPTATAVNNTIDALRAECYFPGRGPCWISGGEGLPDPSEIVPATNGLIWLCPNKGTAELLMPPTPDFFSLNAIDFAFDPDAPVPEEWLRFLDLLWPDDREAIELLQEWFGYCLTLDTRQQKALLLVGPKRAGKGTISRVLRRLIGTGNVCGPTLSGLSGEFGLWSLIGKQLAIIDDARMSNRADQAVVVERVLTITGEGAIDINRKNLSIVTLRLLTRLMLLTNELPRLSDASGALASRFQILTLTESFYGREDTGLEDRICRELPGILLWAIEGWKRLQERGHFVQPATSEDAVEELNNLASPISAFLRDWCRVGAGAVVTVRDLFEAWAAWCDEQGRQAGTQQVFGRDLRAAVPGVSSTQPREGGTRIRAYEGIGLTELGRMTLAQFRAKQERGKF